MGFMQKNVNVFLLLMVLVVAGALAGSSAYYQNTFKKINSMYDDTSKNLSVCRSEVESYKMNLQKTITSLNTTSQDIRRYDELYTAKATALQDTTKSLNQTSTQLKSTQLDLVEMTALKSKYKNDYDEQLSINDGLREQNAVVSAQKAQCESSLLSYKSKLSSANACINEFISDWTGTLTPAMEDEIDSCKK